MTLDAYRFGSIEKPNAGELLSSCGTTLVVANKDASAANAPVDPWDLLDGSPLVTNHANMRPVDVPDDGLYFDMHMAVDGGVAITGATVKVLGKVPSKDPRGYQRKWPYDDDTTKFSNVSDLWIPLLDKDGNHAIVLAGTKDAVNDTAASPWFISTGSYVFLAGCEQVLVFVTSAASGTFDAAMVLARVTG